MGYFVTGLFVGVLSALLWQKYYKGAPVFRPLFERELLLNGQTGRIVLLKKQVQGLEERLAELEKNAAPCRKEEQAGPGTLKVLPGRSEQSLNFAKTKRDRKLLRRQVSELWAQGLSMAQIALKTELGQGEVELIVSLEDRGFLAGKSKEVR